MSPKVSARDLLELFQLAWKVVDSCRQACGEREPLTKEVTSLLGVVSQLQREAEKPNSSLRRQDGVSRDELKSTIRGCRKLLRALDQFLAKYALSHRKGSIRKGLFLKFGNGDVLSMNDVLEELSVHKAALLLNLRLLTPSSRGSAEWSLGKKFPGMQQSVHWTMARINSSHDGSSLSSSYSDDEQTVWKEIQRGLVKDGWPRRDVKKHRKAIKEYIKNLSWSDAFDETPPSSNPSLHREPQGAYPRQVYTPESFPRESFSRDSLPQENFPPPPPPNFPPQDFQQHNFPPPPPPPNFPQQNFPPPPPPNFTPQSFPQQHYERPIFPPQNYARPIFPPQHYERSIFPQQSFSEQENFPEQEDFSEEQNFPEQDFPQQDYNPPPPPNFPPQDFPQHNFPPPPPPNFPPQHFTQPDLEQEEAPQQIYVIRSAPHAPQESQQPESVIYEPSQPAPPPQYIPPSVSDDCQQFDEKSECPLPPPTESQFSVRPCDLSDTFLQCTEKDTWNDMMESLVTTLIDPSKNVYFPCSSCKKLVPTAQARLDRSQNWCRNCFHAIVYNVLYYPLVPPEWCKLRPISKQRMQDIATPKMKGQWVNNYEKLRAMRGRPAGGMLVPSLEDPPLLLYRNPAVQDEISGRTVRTAYFEIAYFEEPFSSFVARRK